MKKQYLWANCLWVKSPVTTDWVDLIHLLFFMIVHFNRQKRFERICKILNFVQNNMTWI